MQFNILGPVEALRGGELLDLGGRKQRAVLAVLILNVGRVVTVDRFVDELWGDEPPARALGTLQAYVSNLRRVLEPDRAPRTPATVLASRAPGYVLQVPDVDVDAVRFERAVTHARALLVGGHPDKAQSELATATALWRGPPLADLATEAFARDPIARLEELHAVAVETRLEADLVLGRHATAVVELEQHVRQHPLRERPWELLMLAMYRCGRQAGALRAFQDARTALVDELGVEPGPALARLERQVLEQDPALDWHPRSPTIVRAVEPPAAQPLAVSRQPFVGRDDELAALRTLLDRSAPRLTLIGGEAGAGKTRLVEEFAAEATDAGWLVVWARCAEAPGAPAFWPFRQVVRAVVEAVPKPEADEAIGASRVDLARIDPEIYGAPEDQSSGTASADAVLYQTYDSVTGFLGRATTGRKVMIVVEDLQWADSSSLRVLPFLLTDPRIPAIRLVGTFRDTDEAANPALHDTLAVLAGDREVLRVSLGGFDGDGVGRLIEIETGEHPDDAVIEVVRRRTGGNAFLVIELARLLAAEGRLSDAEAAWSPVEFPDELRTVINGRLARLPETVRQMLTAASVLSGDIWIDLLAGVIGVPIDDLLDPVEAAVLSHVLVEDDRAGCYHWAHALIREVLYDGLPRVRRARLHAGVALAWEQMWGDDLRAHAAEVAPHAALGAEAGSAELAVRCGVMAARVAADRLAHDQEAMHWQQALDGLALARPGDRATRYDLLMELSRAKRSAGDFVASQRAAREAIEIVTRMGDDERMARAAVGLSRGGSTAWSWREYGSVDQEAIDVLERALVTLGSEDSALRAEVLGTLAVELYFAANAGERAYELSAEAVDIADRLGDPSLKATVLNMHYVASLVPDGPHKRLAIAQQMVELPEIGAAPAVGLVGRILRMTSRLEVADLDGADADLAVASTDAERLREPAMLAQVGWFKAMRALLAGRLDDAEQLSQEAFALHRRTGLWGALECFSTQLFLLRREQGRIIELEPLLLERVDNSEFTGFREAMALMYLDAGRTGDAVEALGDRIAFPSMPRDWSWLYLTCMQADIAADIADDRVRARLRDELTPFTDQLAVIGTGVGCWGPVTYYVGRLEAALGQTDAAERWFLDSISTAERIGSAPWRDRAASALLAVH